MARQKKKIGRKVCAVSGTLCESSSKVERENKQSMTSCPIDVHRRSAILSIMNEYIILKTKRKGLLQAR